MLFPVFNALGDAAREEAVGDSESKSKEEGSDSDSGSAFGDVEDVPTESPSVNTPVRSKSRRALAESSSGNQLLSK